MSSLTTRLGLKRPDGSDPFLRSDFVANWNKLDDYPGTFICSSVTRPTWGAAQAGMLISETDTGRTVRWTGSAWAIVEQYARVFRGALSPNAALSSGALVTYTVYNDFSIVRPCVVTTMTICRVRKSAATPQSISMTTWIDGTNAEFGYGPAQEYPDGPSGTTKISSQDVTLFGARSVAVGAHDLQVRVTVGGEASTITVVGFKTIILCTEV